MKTLEFNQMEKVNGGDAWSCAGAGLGTISLALGVAAITGPVGWLAFAGFITGSAATGLSLGDCVYDALH